jgi:putative DNA primase/helicase
VSGDLIDLEERREQLFAKLGWPHLVRGDEAELAHHLVRERTKAGPNVFAEGIYREYDEVTGIWPEIIDADLSRTVQRFAGAPVGERKVLKLSSSMVRGTIKLAQDLVTKPMFFDKAPRGIAFANGFVRVEDGQARVEGHRPENLARHAVPIAYDPTASHPELDKFFDEVFADVAEDERAARVMLIQEFAGACLIGAAPRYQRALVFVGPGGNGKSQAEEILRSIFPPRTVCSLPPQQWGERFQIAKLVGCLANIVDEIPERDIVAGDLFKSVITGEPIHTERKHKDPFEHRPIAGHIFSANTLPSTADLSHGFFRRFLIIRFSRDMENAPSTKKDAGKAVVAADLPGIAAWAVEGAARLQRQGNYTVPESSNLALADWKRTSDSVALFVDEKTKPADVTKTIGYLNGTRGSELYGAYREWAGENGYRAVSAKTFGQRMDDMKKGKTAQKDANYYPVIVLSSAPSGGKS